MSSNVIRTPSFSLATVIKPFPDFESKYQGLPVRNNPLALPGTLDRMAGRPGYDPNLLAGVPVPMGSQLMLWVPRFGRQPYGTSTPNYRYRVVWRIRSLTDQINDPDGKLAAHFGALLPGVPQVPSNNPADSAGPRFVIPAAVETLQVSNTQAVIEDPRDATNSIVIQKGGQQGLYSAPDLNPEPGKINVTSAEYQVYNPAQWQAPIVPKYPGPVPSFDKLGAAGLVSQGFYPDGNGTTVNNNANAAFAAGPQFDVIRTTALGDEMLLFIDRAVGETDENWDFGLVDRSVSTLLGTDVGTRPSVPNIGVYLFEGSATA